MHEGPGRNTASSKGRRNETNLEVSGWVTLLGVNETWEQNGIANEENRSVVSNQVPVAIFSVEFHGETTRIPVNTNKLVSKLSRPRWQGCISGLPPYGRSITS